MSEPFVGEIKVFAFSFPPRNYAACDGRLLPIAQNTALFSLLGTFYGGDGRTNFAIPDLRGRTPLHAGGSTPIGTRAGQESVTLTQTTMPAHNHSLLGSSQTATQRPVTNATFAKDTSLPVDFYAPASAGSLVALSPRSLASVGGSQPHNNMQPFQVVNICIALFGIYPARN